MNRILAIFFGILAFSAHSQDANYPNKPIRLIVGYAPGGATDIVARSIAIKLQETLGQTVIVENRAGAGSNIASEFVARSAPDGYTLLLGTIANATNMTAYKNLGYDTMRDFILRSLPKTCANLSRWPNKTQERWLSHPVEVAGHPTWQANS